MGVRLQACMSRPAPPAVAHATAAAAAARARTNPIALTGPRAVLQLQRTAGNAAVSGLLASTSVQRQPTQAQEANFAFSNPGFVTDVGDTRGGGGPFGQADPNEFVLWNYLVGKADLRPGHTAKLFDPIKRWKPLLKSTPDVKVKIVGSASTSGSASTASPLSVKRADALAGFLAAQGIPKDRIETGGVGTRQPLADETTPEGMARNRRVELYLIRPTTVADTPAASTADVVSETVKTNSGFTAPVRSGNTYSYRSLGMDAKATAEGTGPPGAQVGYLQFVRDDKRIGHYAPTGGGAAATPFALDFSRCTKPYLPCKDVAESMAVFTGEKVLDLQPGPAKATGPIEARDFPGVVFPMKVKAPSPARLDSTEWSMEFVLVAGVREGSTFSPIHHAIWRVDSTRKDPLGPNTVATEGARLVAGGVPGAPASLDIGKAMELQTCRFTMRRIDAEDGGDLTKRMCQPHLV